MTQSDISDILKLDKNDELELETQQSIKYKNKKSYSDYKNVSLSISDNEVNLIGI